jgi:hypothetical protein
MTFAVLPILSLACSLPFAVAGSIRQDGAWTWFSDPRAVHYVGENDKTYWGWADTHGSIRISSLDHKTGQVQITTLHYGFEVDDHDAPAILVRPDGRLVVFYSKHNAPLIYYRISTNPEDISAWNDEQTITPFPGIIWITYVQPIYLSAEAKTYLFFRGPDASLNSWSYVTSPDNGDTWSSGTVLLSISPITSPAAFHQYLKVEGNGVDTIYFVHSGHPGNEVSSIYYFSYKAGSFYRANGALIGTTANLPFNRLHLDSVYDAAASGHCKAWIWDVAASNGVPYVTFTTYPSVTDHRYNYAFWNGAAWETEELTSGGTYIDGGSQLYYSGGVVLDHNSPNTVYLSKPFTKREIQKWVTSDKGVTWSVSDVTSNSSADNIRPVSVRKHRSDLPLFWLFGNYGSYTTYSTSIAPVGCVDTSTRTSTGTFTTTHMVGAHPASTNVGPQIPGYLSQPIIIVLGVASTVVVMIAVVMMVAVTRGRMRR